MNILFSEVDKDGNTIEGGIEKENSVIVKYFTADVQKQFMGKKKEESVVLQLSAAFEKDKLEAFVQDLGIDKEDAEAANKYFKLAIVKIGLVEKSKRRN